MNQRQHIERMTETTILRYRPKAQPTQPQPWRRQRRKGRRYCRLVMGLRKMAYLVAVAMVLLAGCGAEVTVTPEATPAATATTESVTLHRPQPTPLAHSTPAPIAPIRVQFGRGTYGTDIIGYGSQAYLLWARAGQVTTLNPQGATMTLGLTSPDGTLLPVDVVDGIGRYVLPANGDYTLRIDAQGAFTVTVEIR